MIAHARLLVIGGNRTRLHEELVAAGGEIHQGRFRRLSVEQIEAALTTTKAEALAAAQPAMPAETMQARLAALWPKLLPSLQRSLEVRMEERASSIRNLLADREEKEVADITAILTELERVIREELKEPEYVQLSLFSPPEREQYSRNFAALEARLAQIPEELEQETAHIHARYADLQFRLFPVAVMFLVPERLTHHFWNVDDGYAFRYAFQCSGSPFD